MPAPMRLRATIGNLQVSAYILPGSWDLSKDKPVCKTCSPVRTKMKAIADVSQLGFSQDLSWTVFECQNCHTQWAALQNIKHDEKSAE
jgi:hypothetical protein